MMSTQAISTVLLFRFCCNKTGIDQQGGKDLGVDAVAKIVGMIDTVAGQIGIFLSHEKLIPDTGHIR